MKKLLPSVLFCTLLGFSIPAHASAFTGLTVVGAPASDPLNARNWPSTSSTVVRTYTNGTVLSGTSRCKNIITNESFKIDGPQSKAWKYNQMKAANVWCQIWHEVPNGSGVFKIGWVRGRNVKP